MRPSTKVEVGLREMLNTGATASKFTSSDRPIHHEFVIVESDSKRVKEQERTAEDEKKLEKPFLLSPALSVLRGALRGLKGASYLPNYRFHNAYSISVNTAAGKYLQFIGGGTSIAITTILQSASELGPMAAIWDEIFCHSAEFMFEPFNQFSGNSTASSSAAGSPGDTNTVPATIYGLQHDQAIYPDSGSAAQAALNADQSKWVNLARPFRFVWRNIEKFAKDGPVGDMTTSGVTQGWCNIGDVSKYGGKVGIATTVTSGAAAAIGTLLEGGVFGHVMIRMTISLRYRS